MSLSNITNVNLMVYILYASTSLFLQMYKYDYCIVIGTLHDENARSSHIQWLIRLRDQILKKDPGANICIYPFDGKYAYLV